MQRPSDHRYDGPLTIALLALYAMQRLWVVLSGRVPLDSDEGIKGIMALAALRGEFSAFFYGQDYMGSLPALLSAPFVGLTGGYPLGQRLATIAFGLATLLLWRGILCRWKLAGAWPWFALLMALAPEFVTEWSSRFRGTSGLMLIATAWVWGLTALLADERPFGEQVARWFGLGVLTGLAWWTNQLVILVFVPGFATLLLVRAHRERLLDAFRSPAMATTTLAVIAAVMIVILRASLDYRGPASALLYDLRGLVLGGAAAVLAFVAGMAWHGGAARWVVAGAAGFLLGYLPALVRVYANATIYNTTSLQHPLSWMANFGSLFLECFGGFVGLLTHGDLRPIGWPVAIVVFVVGVFLLSWILLLVQAARALRGEGESPDGPVFLAVMLVFGWAFLAMSVHTYSSAPHYALLVMIASLVTLGWLCDRLARLHAIAPLAIVVPLVFVNLASVAHAPRVATDALRQIPAGDAQLVRDLEAEGITIAATSFADSSMGYWDAYRLAFASGGRVAIHPILHMPRIDAWRVRLRDADRTALVVRQPDRILEILTEHGIAHERRDYAGGLTLIPLPDKAAVDAASLFDYRKSLAD